MPAFEAAAASERDEGMVKSWLTRGLFVDKLHIHLR